MSKDAAYDVSLPSLEIIQFSLGSGHLVKRLRLYQIASRTGEGKKHLFESRFIRGYGIGDTHTRKRSCSTEQEWYIYILFFDNEYDGKNRRSWRGTKEGEVKFIGDKVFPPALPLKAFYLLMHEFGWSRFTRITDARYTRVYKVLERRC